MEAEFILFADAALDSRVFAIAHERLALFQGALWGWGGTIGIPTIDYYFIPEILWTNSYCQQLGISHLPQELFLEQVIPPATINTKVLFPSLLIGCSTRGIALSTTANIAGLVTGRA